MLAICAFGALSLLGGWLVVWGGGFHHAPSRTSPNTDFIAGVPALLMALLQFLAAALAFTWLLRLRLAQAVAVALAFGLVFVPPLVYVLRLG